MYLRKAWESMKLHGLGRVLSALSIIALSISTSSAQGGDVLLFERTGSDSLYSLDLETGSLVRHTAGRSPIPSPDGKSVIIRRENNTYVTRLSGGPEIALRGVSHTWSMDSRRVAYQSRSQIFMTDIASAGETLVAVRGSLPTWSMSTPDLLYYSRRQEQSLDAYDIHQVNVSTMADGLVRPAFNLAGEGMSASADGKHLIVSNCGDRGLCLKIYNVDSRQIVDVGPSGFSGARSPRWSPNSDEVAFVVPGSEGGLYVMDIATGTELRIVASDSREPRGPSWSPDGSQIAFFTFDGDMGNIFVVNSDGTGLTSLGAGHSPVWISDPRDPTSVVKEQSWGETKADVR